MSTIILLGAGASFGSKEVEPSLPPLGPDLFDGLVEQGGIAATLPDRIKAIFKEDFEAGMMEYYDYSNGNVMRFQRELAKYLVKYKPKEGNLYIKLIQAVNTKRVIFVSLNYDMLLEASADFLGKDIIYSGRSINNEVRVLKIHGSSNFWPKIPPNVIIKNITLYGNGKSDFESGVKALNQADAERRCYQDSNFSPAIAMFAVGKMVKVCSKFVEKQREIWLGKVKAANKVIVIGVKVHEVDEHIWGELGKSKSSVFYFGGDSDKEAFYAWKLKHKKHNAYFNDGYFDAAIEFIKKNLKK
ncbi:hypothetical protein [Shewanella xiamenensis]|uniref:hypothetical protein n=1 Tax=Shewanella xiamenensis TaxID=332186 RepID=UPI0021C083D7|nr:hypothetical protein [Shewanella xiamenensis]MCT8866946.1 hypothetical protein [Shewanella xiamenensis]